MALQKTSSKPKLRFAPSPNGYLHLGHAFSALTNADLAKRLGGTWLLRIEDIDQNRSKPEFIQNIFDDLKWLGLDWPEPVLHQSTRLGSYRDAAKKLHALNLLYPCFCSRKKTREVAGTKVDPDGAPIYPGTCKNLNHKQIQQKLEAKIPVQYRLHMDKAVAKAGAKAGPLHFKQFTQDDPLTFDKITCQPKNWGDVVIIRKDTPTSYHLSVVVDDAFQNITHVIRGKDLEAATNIHILLQNLLEFPSPAYFHHQLINDDKQQKLAKSSGSTNLKDLQKINISAKQIREQLNF